MSRLPTKAEAEQAFMLAYCDNGQPWDAEGKAAFERWWRGEDSVLTPVEQARVDAGGPIPDGRVAVCARDVPRYFSGGGRR